MSAAGGQDQEDRESALGDTTREQLEAIWSIWALGMGTVAAVVLVLSITAVTTWVAMQAFTSLFSLVAAATLGVLMGISAAAYAWFVRPHRYKLMFVVAVGATSLLSPLVAFGVILVLRQAAEGIAESPVH